MLLSLAVKLPPQATPQALETALKLYDRLVVDREYSREDLMRQLEMVDRRYVQANYIKPLVDAGLLALKYSDKPNHPKQRYICKKKSVARD